MALRRRLRSCPRSRPRSCPRRRLRSRSWRRRPALRRSSASTAASSTAASSTAACATSSICATSSTCAPRAASFSRSVRRAGAHDGAGRSLAAALGPPIRPTEQPHVDRLRGLVGGGRVDDAR